MVLGQRMPWKILKKIYFIKPLSLLISLGSRSKAGFLNICVYEPVGQFGSQLFVLKVLLSILLSVYLFFLEVL